MVNRLYPSPDFVEDMDVNIVFADDGTADHGRIVLTTKEGVETVEPFTSTVDLKIKLKKMLSINNDDVNQMLSDLHIENRFN